ncbi:MAG: polysaccharide pyruvyl transferase family protein [Clostridia bacterium]|nr:polysaccharide pyruvyl transferase family protein [Clostridia bacterium]
MKKTVGMMTSEESFLNNYGAALQGYALQKVIRELGFSPKIIRYNGYAPKRKFGFIKDVIKKILGIKRGVVSKEQQKRNEELKEILNSHQKEIDSRTKYFSEFQNDLIDFYSDERFTWETLQKRPPKFDVYVCGSDQIWNPVFHGGICDRGYFLDFAPIGKKRIAYAPSLGVDYIPESCAREMKELIAKMFAVSVREEKGAELLTELVGKKINSVLDPTLLLDKKVWLEISKIPSDLPKDYILCYRFSDNDKMLNVVKEISKKTGLPVVSLPLTAVSMNDPFINVFNAGPREFIGLIKNAKLVLTDSFHATVFSFLMDTPFLTFMREQYVNGKNSMNSRVVSLLEKVNLLERIVAKMEDINYETLFYSDYSVGKQKILLDKEDSINYLKTALERDS